MPATPIDIPEQAVTRQEFLNYFANERQVNAGQIEDELAQRDYATKSATIDLFY